MTSSSRKYGLFDYAQFIADRVDNFTGRAWVWQEIDAWLGQSEAERYFLLTGEPGSGKSAVAARLAQFAAGEAQPPTTCQHLTLGFLRAVHFCRATSSDWIDARNFARSLALQLASIEEFKMALKDVGDREININIQMRTGPVEAGGTVQALVIENLTIPSLNGQEAFNRIVLDPLRTIYDNGYDQPILILVDSLDEALATTEIKITDLLANIQGLDRRVRFILTSRPDPRVENAFLATDGLSLSAPKHAADNNQDITDFVALRLQQDTTLSARVANLPATQATSFASNISAKADGNFQYVTFLLNAMVAGQQPLDNLSGLPIGLDGLYYESLRRVVALGKKDWATEYQPFLGVLSVALEPLPLELLQTYTAATTSLWNVYTDLFQFIEAMPLPPFAGERTHTEDRYRLYHQSVVDFLRKKQWDNGKGQMRINDYYIAAEDWHVRIVAACQGTAGSWAQVDWPSAASYTLRRLGTHLFQLRQDKKYRRELHALLGTPAFLAAHRARLDKPYLLLDDLRLALNLALEDAELAQSWRHIREVRRVMRQQLDFEPLLQAVTNSNQTGDYVHVMERTSLYGYLPNSQALARLWIAWNAATSGHASEAQTIVKRTLDRLPPRGVTQLASQQAGAEDAIGETLQRLLLRIAQAAQTTPEDQCKWLCEALSAWPAAAVDSTVARLSEPLASWGEIVNAAGMNDPLEHLFQELQAQGGRLDADMPPILDGETVYLFQKRLAAGLFNSRQEGSWPANVQKAIVLIALDDYPSYREMALSWIAATALAQESPALAQQALAAVLKGMFRPSPGFWGDTVAAAMSGMERENIQAVDAMQLLSLLEHVEAVGERGVDPSVIRKMPEIIEWRRTVGLPEDPWSFRQRRRSAVAAVLHQQGDLAGAEALLQEADEEPHLGSYAGFRALARLSLACRWLEWHRLPEAFGQVSLAEQDAWHVRDEVLRQERIDLIHKMQQWITSYGGTPEYLAEEDALTQLQQKSGLERGLFLEFLSALWSDNAARLKRLLPLALEDATTTDAVLGRWLSVEARQPQPSKPFLQLVKELDISAGVESE